MPQIGLFTLLQQQANNPSKVFTTVQCTGASVQVHVYSTTVHCKMCKVAKILKSTQVRVGFSHNELSLNTESHFLQNLLFSLSEEGRCSLKL